MASLPQADIDVEPEQYKHYFINEIPERFPDKVDVRRFGVGERVVRQPWPSVWERCAWRSSNRDTAKSPKLIEMKGKDTWEIGHYTRIPQLNERGVNLE